MDKKIHRLLLDEKLDPREKAALLEEIENNPELRKEYHDCLNSAALASLYPGKEDGRQGRAAWNGFLQRRKKSGKRSAAIRIAWQAAVIVFVAAGTWIASQQITGRSILREAALSQNTISVPAGQRTSITLSDGSKVWLNSLSTLTYPAMFTGSERSVTIDGEAYFEVKKDTGKPFRVQSPSMRVTVLGTSFNLRDYMTEEEAEVALMEGSVEVSINGRNESWVLEPGKYLNYKKGAVNTGRIDENFYLWRNGIYYFENATLEDIARKLEVYYDVIIRITDPQLRERLYTGKFRQQDGVYEILRIIGKTYPYTINRIELTNEYILY